MSPLDDQEIDPRDVKICALTALKSGLPGATNTDRILSRTAMLEAYVRWLGVKDHYDQVFRPRMLEEIGRELAR